jgi:asparagine synthase (glutamine-hydrolysing)
MPGIVGLATGEVAAEEKRAIVSRMQDLITHLDFHKRDDPFVNDNIAAARSHTDIIQREPQPYKNGDLYIWFEGEFYDQEELCKKHGLAKGSDPEILCGLLSGQGSLDFLREINGIFCAAVYDAGKKKVRLIIDRYGLRHLYWTVHKGVLAWGSEVKAMMALPGFEPKINREALSDFFNTSWLLGDKTWFEGVELLSPATVLAWDIEKKSVEKHTYWSWDDIVPLPDNFDEPGVVEELAKLFTRAVEKHTIEGDVVGVDLSGGLDSRTILAAMPERCRPVHAFTFGKRGCDDVRIAIRAAKVKGAAHHVHEINSGNWFTLRLEGVWWTDGELGLINMHSLGGIKKQAEFISIDLSGFLGDAVIGGSYIDRTAVNVLEKGRRCIDLGVRILNAYFQTRIPFFDNDFLELIMSVPEKFKADSGLYAKMLLFAFPEFFREIPWQYTGVPVSSSEKIVSLSKFAIRLKNRMYRELARGGLNLSSPYSFTDYKRWILSEPERTFFEKVLLEKSALYREFIPREQVLNAWERHLGGEDLSGPLCRYLTLEIWLQQVYEGKYRNSLK